MTSFNRTALHSNVFSKLVVWIVIITISSLSYPAANALPAKYFYVQVVFSLLMFAATYALGNSETMKDIREIALWDIFFEVFLLAATAHKPLYYFIQPHIKLVNYIIFTMYSARIYWFAANRDRSVFVRWPVFGILGALEKWRNRGVKVVTSPTSEQAILGYIVIFYACPLVGLILLEWGATFLFLGSLYAPTLLVFAFSSRLIRHLDEQDQALIEQAQRLSDEIAAREIAALEVEALRVDNEAAKTSIQTLTGALDDCEAVVCEIKEGRGDELLIAYSDMRKDKRADFMMLAKSIAFKHPRPQQDN